MKSSLLAPYLHALEAGSTLRWKGRVNQVVGNLIESEGPFGFVGESCEIMGAGDKTYAAEIVGFRGTTILSMTADQPQGIRLGDQIVAWGARPSIRVGAGLLGRVIDPAGNPLDGKRRLPRHTRGHQIDGSAPLPLERVAIREPLGCGIKAIDGFMTCGMRSACRHSRRKRRGKEHADWDDGARNSRRHDGSGAGRRAWSRSGRVP